MLNQWEPWACFPATRRSHLGGDGRQRHPCSLCGRFGYCHCTDWMLEMEAFCCDLSIFHLDFNPEHMEIWGSFAITSSWSFLWHRFTWRARKWVADPFLPMAGVFCSFESWYRWPCSNWDNGGQGSVSSKIPNEHLDFWMQPLYLPTRGQLLFSSEVTDWIRWTGWICHTYKQVLRPILCYWNALPVVTVFLKDISGAAAVSQKLWPVIYL